MADKRRGTFAKKSKQEKIQQKQQASRVSSEQARKDNRPANQGYQAPGAESTSVQQQPTPLDY